MPTTLWATDDKLKQERLNRGAIIGRLSIPMYDVNDAGAVQVTAQPLDGVALAATTTTYYTAAALTEIFAITLCNTDSVARVVNLYLVPSAGSAAAATSLFRDTVQPGEQVRLEGPWFLATGDTLRADAASASVVSMRAELLTWSAQPAGLTLKVVNGAALTTALLGSPGYYRAPTSSLTQAVLLAATLCNTDSVSRTPHVHVVPTGGSAAAATRIWSDALVAGETTIFGAGIVLEPGDFIDAKADAGSVVGMRLTILEVQ
jgi:hypothetical protein